MSAIQAGQSVIDMDSLARHIIENSPEALFAISPDGKILSWNNAAEGLLGYTSDEALGLQVYPQISGALNYRDPDEVWREAMDAGKARYTSQRMRKNGELILLETSLRTVHGSDGELQCLVGSMRESPAGKVEADPLANPEFLALIADSADALLFLGSDGAIQFSNLAAELLFGYEDSELIGKRAEELIPKRFQAAYTRQLAAYVERPEFTLLGTDSTLLGQRKDGQEFKIRVAVRPFASEQGLKIGVEITDPSSSRLLERMREIVDELKADNQRLIEQSKVKHRFLAHMTHELRTPLSAIMGFADLLNIQLQEPELAKEQQFLQEILIASEHLLNLVDTVIEQDRSQGDEARNDLVPVNINELVSQSVSMLREFSSGKSLNVSVETDQAIGVVLLDPQRFRQVLFNFLSNAMKFTPSDENIIVRVRRYDTSTIRLEVEDTGCGIEPQDLPEVFCEYRQFHPEEAHGKSGSGLGLAVTKEIVEALGGRVGAESTPGEGSLFWAMLPLNPGDQTSNGHSSV